MKSTENKDEQSEMLDAPSWLSGPKTKCFAIPNGARQKAEIKNGQLICHASDEFTEAWERLQYQCGPKYMTSWKQGDDPKGQKGLPPDGVVWLVKRACDRGDKLGSRCTMMAGEIDCTYCHGTGHTHHLVREDAEEIKKHHDKWLEDVLELLPEIPDIAGLRFIMPERACDALFHDIETPKGEKCLRCDGTGTISRKTFDVWRKGEQR